LAVLAAACLHASWNAMAKGSGGGSPVANVFRLTLGGSLTTLPVLAMTGLPNQASWGYVAASAAIHTIYLVLIGLAYRTADYSAVYPLMRGGAPLLTTFLAAIFIGERLAPAAVIGIGLLCFGVFGLGFDAVRKGGLDRRSLVVAVLTAGTIVAYTLVDGLGARASGNAAAYVVTMMTVTALVSAPAFFALEGGALLFASPATWGRGIIAGLMANLSYGTALWAMTKAPIGLVGAVRETSVLFATVIAAVVLRERFGLARWAAAATIVAGLVLARAG
jgi:drug/metabolite transporter (DMT)-like permease